MAGNASAPMPAVAGGAGGAMNMSPQASAPCIDDPMQVMLLGDGYLTNDSHSFPADLAREVGVSYRNEVKLFAGWMTSASPGLNLPDVYGEAVMRDSDVRVVIMTGGGDDIYFPVQTVSTFAPITECKIAPNAPELKACQDVVVAVMDAAQTLLVTMADGGVRDVIYLGYPRIPSGPAFLGGDPNPLYDYLSAMTRSLCEGTEVRTSGKLRCHFLDLAPIFEGHADWFSTVDSYYPNAMGSAAMAKAVAKLLRDECIAQDARSGCCR